MKQDLFWDKLNAEVVQGTQLLDTVLDSMASGVFLVNTSGIITYWNKAAEKIRAVNNTFLENTDPEVIAELGLNETILEGQTQSLNLPWMRFFLTYDPAVTLKKVKCPVLALNGSKDLQVPARQNLDVIAGTLKEAGHPDYTVEELPDLNHLFQKAETGHVSEYGKIEQTFSPVALERISEWIGDRFLKN